VIVALLRHGRTAWNDAQRLQGRANIPLTAAGREQVLRWRLPAELSHATVCTSPLVRAVETARLAARCEPVVVPALIEMDWGAWEGTTFAALRADHADAFAAAEARGLDFRPPGGESLREIQQRVLAWLASLAATGGPVLAVTHKGVLNVLVAHLTGWNGIGRSPVKLRPDCVHLLELDQAGALRAVEWSRPLLVAPG
jgi:probable phosphoglycerate mutase